MQSRKSNYLLISASILFLAVVFAVGIFFVEKGSEIEIIRVNSGGEGEVLVAEREGWINYAIAKRDLDGDGVDEVIRLFRSVKPLPELVDPPLYELDLGIYTSGEKIVYNFSDDVKKSLRFRQYFNSEVIDFLDIDGDDVYELVFKSASKEGSIFNHVIFFDKDSKKYVRHSPDYFIVGEGRGFSWIKKINRINKGFPIVAIPEDGEGYSGKYLFRIYTWDANAKVFRVAREILSYAAYESASQAIYNEGNNLPVGE